MTFIRDKARTLLLTRTKLVFELRKAESRITFYQWLALTGWMGVVGLLLQGYLP
jgi:hypothetical protein